MNIKPVDPKGICFCHRSSLALSVVSCSNQSCPVSEFHPSCLRITSIPNNCLYPLFHKSCTFPKKNCKPVQQDILQRALKLDTVCTCEQKALRTDTFLECHGDICQNRKFFHLQCLHYKRMPNNARTTWKFPACKSSVRQIV